jgi:hypothetical protein
LLDNVFVGEIIEIMRKGPLPAAADALLAKASARMSDRGGTQPSKPDDLTIVLYRSHAPKRKQRAAE